MRECINHHLACDCREKLFEKSMKTHRKAQEWSALSNAGLSLRMGELTAQEVRTLRALLNCILSD